jgi:hypothetical protein
MKLFLRCDIVAKCFCIASHGTRDCKATEPSERYLEVRLRVNETPTES